MRESKILPCKITIISFIMSLIGTFVEKYQYPMGHRTGGHS